MCKNKREGVTYWHTPWAQTIDLLPSPGRNPYNKKHRLQTNTSNHTACMPLQGVSEACLYYGEVPFLTNKKRKEAFRESCFFPHDIVTLEGIWTTTNKMMYYFEVLQVNTPKYYD